MPRWVENDNWVEIQPVWIEGTGEEPDIEVPKTPRKIIHNIPGCTGVISIRVTESFNAAVSQAMITCYNTTLGLGNSISFNIGYEGGQYGKIFSGYVTTIERNLPDATTTVMCEDELSKAIDYYMASDRPDAPFSRSNILTQTLVSDILKEAKITNFSANVPLNITWGTGGSKVEFNLVSAWQAAKTVVDALAWDLYCDRNGTVRLTGQQPYISGGENADFIWTDNSDLILSISYSKSAEELRNRVVVYGIGNLSATASTSSPHLPPGFYKTAVIATPIITSQSLAQQVANLNLTRFNRLTEALNLTIEGDYRYSPRKYVYINFDYFNIDSLWFIYQVEHMIDESGYTCTISLTR